MFWIGMIPILAILFLSMAGTLAYVSSHTINEPVEKPLRDTVVVEKEVIRYRDTFIPPVTRKERKPETIVQSTPQVQPANTPDTSKQ